VWRIAAHVPGIDGVFIATDDTRIAEHAKAFGAQVVMTSESCRNGTERIEEALRVISSSTPPSIVINLQGDAPLVPPWVLEGVVEDMTKSAAVGCATPIVRLTRDQFSALKEFKERGIVTGTTVSFDRSGNALYFSKNIIPYLRDIGNYDRSPVYQHIGLYGYRPETLRKLIALPMGPFEFAEQLEQLRALEHGVPIKVVEVDLKGRTLWSVDNPEDVSKVEEIIEREGELV